jgi:hypothetical protein
MAKAVLWSSLARNGVRRNAHASGFSQAFSGSGYGFWRTFRKLVYPLLQRCHCKTAGKANGPKLIPNPKKKGTS